MKKLLYKEFSLALHPASVVFLLLSSMLLIPNYPYFVIFFYSCLGFFFICLSGRENKDIYYTMILPVEKKDIVKARISMVVLLEIAQIVIAVPFMLARLALVQTENEVGLEANTALLGLGFVFFGLFNIFFFTSYYKKVTKVGLPFLKGCIATTVFMIIVEASAHAVPFVRDYLDTADPQHMAYKAAFLAGGLLIFAALTLAAYKSAVRSFEKLDL